MSAETNFIRIAQIMLALVFGLASSQAARAEAKLRQLGEGTIKGPILLAEGESLRGAGYSKTIIDAQGAENGVVVRGGSGAVISDITVRGALGANVLVQNAENVVVERVRGTGGLIGFNITDCRNCRLENLISDANRYGVVVAGGENNVVVNCSIAANASLGLSIPSGLRTVSFNNCITDSVTAIYVGEQAKDLTLDHNLYLGLYIGKFRSEIGRNTLNNWKYLSGHDAHSISIPVKYEKPAEGRFAVTSALDWSLDRSVTVGWGAASMKDMSAPTEDIDGNTRPATPGLGAFEPNVTPPRPADGALTVESSDGLTSAGVFDARGKLVSYLFHALPLRAGKHPVWLPARAYNGRPIEAGDYEVRSVQSKLNWEYLGWIANTSTLETPHSSCAVQIDALVFDDAGHLLVGRGPSEEHANLRGYEAATGKWLWTFKGNSDTRGMTVPGDGLLYALRNDSQKEARITRLDPTTGKIAPWGQSDYGHHVLKDGLTLTGIASHGEKIFYVDQSKNALLTSTLKSPEPQKLDDIASPESPCFDAKTSTLWIISGEKLIALSPEGKTLAESQPVPQPVALAVRDGRLAVASKQTGKVHLFDGIDAKQLKPLHTIGRGDGPYGLILPERFMFQNGAMPVRLALGPNNELAVGEREGRLQLFDRDGKLVWSTFSSGGWSIVTSQVTPGRVFAGDYSLILDSETKAWKPESFHPFPADVVADFQIDGQTFLLFNHAHLGISFAKFTPEKMTLQHGLICRWGSKDPWTWRTDSNQDGAIDDQDAIESTVTDAQGQPLVNPRPLPQWGHKISPNGEITISDGWMTRWPCAGLDEKGRPTYRMQDRVSLLSDKSDLISPYDFKPVGGRPSLGDCALRPGGGWIGNISFPTSPGVRSILLPGGCEMAAIGKDGVVDWVHTFGQYPGSPKIGSVDVEDGICIASLAASYDFFLMNLDGLLLDGFSMPEKTHYVGHWVDHRDTVSTFVDKQGKLNLLTCDYMWSRNHWFRLRDKQIREQKTSLKVTPEAASRLAALPAPQLDVTAGKPATPVVRIPKLKAPFAIDGDLQKWRDAGLTPQIIVTPESSMGIEGGARDCSAIARLAWHDQNLYLQVLRFDDVLAMHQPSSRFYLQDAVEMAVNGIMEGIKHNLSVTTDRGAANHVDAWDVKAHVLDQKDAPIVIKVLDNAEAVTERQLIENIFGVRLSDSKVQLFETKIPMDAKTYAGKDQARFELKSGAQFWLGMMIDDNDEPGTDVQNILLWPATYGTFSEKESGAIAELE